MVLPQVLENLVCEQKRTRCQVGWEHNDRLEIKHRDFQDVLGKILSFCVSLRDLDESLKTTMGADKINVEIEN
jgi:hypothetical protein